MKYIYVINGNARLFFIAAMGLFIFWSNLSFAEIYMYKKNGSYFITDTYQGAGFVKIYKTRRPHVQKTLLSVNPCNTKSMDRSSDFTNEIHQASKKYGINPNLVKAVIKVESAFKPDAVSPKGAMGLMQLMPKTAKRFNVTDPFDPYQNIDSGAKYLGFLLSLFDGNIRLALAAYNAGEQTVKKYGTIPPFKETNSYISKVLSHFKSLERKRNIIYKNISPSGTVFFSDDLQIKFTQ